MIFSRREPFCRKRERIETLLPQLVSWMVTDTVSSSLWYAKREEDEVYGYFLSLVSRTHPMTRRLGSCAPGIWTSCWTRSPMYGARTIFCRWRWPGSSPPHTRTTRTKASPSSPGLTRSSEEGPSGNAGDPGASLHRGSRLSNPSWSVLDTAFRHTLVFLYTKTKGEPK